MAELRDAGGLLQRAGLQMPVADLTGYDVSYAEPIALMRDLRAMGEGNAMARRDRRPARRDVLLQAAALYAARHGVDGRIPARFEVIVLTGWAPGEGQPQPLRPGSAKARLAEALNVPEHPLDPGD